MGKRKIAADDKIRSKIQKLQQKLEKLRRRRIISSESDSEECEDGRVTDPSRTMTATPERSFEVPGSPEPGPSRARSPTPARNSPSAAAPDEPAPDEDEQLDLEILALLGDAPKPDTKFGKPIHKDIASRWQDILSKGMAKDVKDKIFTEYLIPENCPLLLAPTLNPEVKAALAETLIKRDMAMYNKQKQLGIALAALGRAVQLILAKSDHNNILKPISDACRVLCDSHNAETMTRRGFVISSTKSELRETLRESNRDAKLFGDSLAEKIKSAKTIQKSSADLKPTSRVFNKNNFSKIPKNGKRPQQNDNWRSLPRKIPARPEAERQRPAAAQRSPATWSNGYQQREVADRPKTARPNRRY